MTSRTQEGWTEFQNFPQTCFKKPLFESLIEAIDKGIDKIDKDIRVSHKVFSYIQD